MKELRTLLPSEEDFLKKLVEIKESSSKDKLSKLQSGYLLQTIVEFNFAAIKWDKDCNDSIKIYYEEKSREDEAKSDLFRLFDYLLFIEELEKIGLIAVLPVIEKTEEVCIEEERILYNRKDYGKDKQVFDNWSENSSHKGFVFLDPSRKERWSWINIISYLEKYVYLKIIYPTSALESFVKNGFKTQEQIRHNEEMGNLNKQLKNTRCSLTITAFTLIATIILGTIKQCSSTKIESDELKTIALSGQNLPKPEPPCITINLVDSITSSNNSITMNGPIGH
jgi:hypothetical protein